MFLLKALISLFLGIFFYLPVMAQLDFTLSGGPSHLGLGRATVAYQGTASVFSNQASTAFLDGMGFEANALRRYNIQGLDLFGVGGFYTSSFGTIGASIQQYGFDTYKEQKIAFFYSRKFEASTSASLQFDYLNLSLEEGSKGIFSFELGILTKIANGIWLGGHLFSPAPNKITQDFDLPLRMRIGPRFVISQYLDLYVELEKSIDFDPALKLGIDYRIQEQFRILVGVIPSLSEYSFGFGYTFGKNLNVKGAFSYDDTLEISPSFGISYYDSKK